MTGEDIFGAIYIPPPFKNMLLLVFSEQLPRFLCGKRINQTMSIQSKFGQYVISAI